jgi:hypothetical protein
MSASLERARTLLILGRVSNLPTVWSNLIAGSVVAYMDISAGAEALLLFAGSLIYIGGMYLNDFCDAPFDAQYCPQRPIPAGKISHRAVGILAVLWFVVGLGCLVPFGWQPVEVGLLLVAAIVLYDFHHKNVSWAPLDMGFCRFLLYPLAATAASSPYDLWSLRPFLISPDLLWHPAPDGIALAFYVAGITYLARGESRPDRPVRWAFLLLLVPVVAALTYSVLLPYSGGLPQFFCLLLMGWMAWLLVPLWAGTNCAIGRVVSGLLAGIVLVDAIAVTPMLGFQAGWFLLLFALAVLLQRVIPAT